MNWTKTLTLAALLCFTSASITATEGNKKQNTQRNNVCCEFINEDTKNSIEEIANIKEKYVIIGENHKNISQYCLISELIDTGKFSVIYLEAFPEGKNKEDTNKEAVFYFNPEKYNLIVNKALNKNMKVLGLENNLHEKRVSGWADYIIENEDKGRAIILIGEFHTSCCKKESRFEFYLPSSLIKRGASRDNLVIIMEGRNGREGTGNQIVRKGLHNANKFDEKEFSKIIKPHADYFWFGED